MMPTIQRVDVCQRLSLSGTERSASVLRTRVTERDGWFLSGAYDQFTRDSRTDGVRQVITAIGRMLLAGEEADLTMTKERLLRALGANAQVFSRMPEFVALLDLEPDQNGEGDGSTQARRRSPPWAHLPLRFR